MASVEKLAGGSLCFTAVQKRYFHEGTSMKKATTLLVSNSESGRKKVLRLSRETIRRLRPDDLSRAVGGSCDMTSDTTLKTKKPSDQI